MKMLCTIRVEESERKKRVGKAIRCSVAKQQCEDVKAVHYKIDGFRNKRMWRKIANIIPRQAEAVLFAGNIYPDSESGITPFRAKEYYSTLAIRTGIESLKNSNINPNNIKIGLIDLKGEFFEIIQHLVGSTSDMRVVSENTLFYEQISDEMMYKYGAPITYGNSRELLRGCDIVFAPRVINEDLLLSQSTIIFTKCMPKYIQQGQFVHSSRVNLPYKWRSICPQGIDHTYFAAALREGCSLKKADNFKIKSCVFGNARTDILQISQMINSREKSLMKS